MGIPPNPPAYGERVLNGDIVPSRTYDGFLEGRSEIPFVLKEVKRARRGRGAEPPLDLLSANRGRSQGRPPALGTAACE